MPFFFIGYTQEGNKNNKHAWWGCLTIALAKKRGQGSWHVWEIKRPKKRHFSASLWKMTPFFLCNTHNKGGVHNEHTCWGGLAIVTSREEERASCCHSANKVGLVAHVTVAF
jgi:hypothetical protein